MNKLYCHTAITIIGEEEPSTTVGKFYDIVLENDFEYGIINDMGEDHYFNKDLNTSSRFDNWFELINNDMNQRELEIIKSALEWDIIHQRRQLDEIEMHGGGDIDFEIWLHETEALHKKVSLMLLEAE